MRRNYATFVLIAIALFCLFTAWTSGSAPQNFAKALGLSVINAGGLNEIRAQYSGFFVAMAVACILSLLGVIARQSALVGSMALFGGLIAGRLVSLGLDGGMGDYGGTIVLLHAIDSVGLVLSTSAFFADRVSASRSR